jgi:MOSC domain-containing protein YiiM
MNAPIVRVACGGMARVVSVNVGGIRTVDWSGRSVTTGIWKTPVAGRIAVRGVNLAGDDQADRRVHGGPDKAVYAYAVEDYSWWTSELGRDLAPGTFGENLTVGGVDLGASVIGARWRVGSTELEVSQPRQPCFKLGLRMGDAAFVDAFGAAARFGAYLRIRREGEVGAGDEIDITEPTEGISVRELGLALHGAEIDFLERVAADPAVAVSWREWANRQLARQ